jgi:hypothetical protein
MRLRQAPLKTAALLTKLKLQFGLMSAAKAVEWARSRSAKYDDPPYFLYEITSARNPTAAEIAAVLDDATPGVDEIPALRLLFGGLSKPLKRNPKLATKFASVLAKIDADYGEELPPDMSKMSRFKKRMERVMAGRPIKGDSALRVAADMAGFLGRYREST